MDSEYPPLPSGRGVDTSLQNPSDLSLRDGNSRTSDHLVPEELISDVSGLGRKLDVPEKSQETAKVILANGDMIVEYVSPHQSSAGIGGETHCWKVSSRELMGNSPYFRALLDPDKFMEGRQFLQQKTIGGHSDIPSSCAERETHTPADYHCSNTDSSLPTVRLPEVPLKLGADAIELFLKLLCFSAFDDDKKSKFNAEMKVQSSSLVARLLEVADAFNSPHVVRAALQRSGYAFGKGKSSLSRFDSSMLRYSEDRIRQIIYIARFLGDNSVFQVMTHTLIILGSKYWVNGVEPPSSTTPFRWRYLADGLEEELYYRRQCILNTITDIQAYFLRAYGALDEDTDPLPKPPASNPPLTAAPIRPRLFQCRCGFGNSSACDAFHLGQMTRFFALRTRTIFLGSSLIDPDFSPDDSAEDTSDNENTNSSPHQHQPPTGPPSDITAILSSLKQCPDYQIDTNHIGCGVRRRILPPLDCIERFVGDGRGLLGVDLRLWDAKQWPLASNSWGNRSLRRARVIEIRLSKISAIPMMTSGVAVSRAESQEENARLLFTAKKRNWEAN